MAAALELLAIVTVNSGDDEAARPMAERALAIREKLAPDDPKLARGFNLVGGILRGAGEAAAARP